MTTIDTVVCVHGVRSFGVSMYLVKRRLEKEHGMRVLLFNYPSVRGTLDENAAELADFVHSEGLEATHLIGHSLGGVIALRMLAQDDAAVPGRLVCLGAPLTGSRTAEFLSRKDWGQQVLGHSLRTGVVREAANEWGSHVCAKRDVGIIAGTLPMGVGKLFANFDGESDGTVAVSETHLDGAKDHICMRVSHSGLLVSSDVADQAAAFLKRGEFLREEQSRG
jgi:pimeloyl-ACP methyl ester carboxylesterase